VLHNLRCAVGICIRFHRLYPDIDEMDLIGEAHIALIDAVNTFDISRGNKFITYAYWSIRNRIIRYLRENLFPFRLPASVVKKIRILKQYLKLEKQIGEVPSLEELSAVIGSSKKTCRQLLQLTDFEQEPVKPPVALPAIDAYNRVELMQDLETHLTSEELYIIKRITGLDGAPPDKQKEIAADLGLSDEAVKQKKQHALAKLAVLFSKSDVLIEAFARAVAKYPHIDEDNMLNFKNLLDS